MTLAELADRSTVPVTARCVTGPAHRAPVHLRGVRTDDLPLGASAARLAGVTGFAAAPGRVLAVPADDGDAVDVLVGLGNGPALDADTLVAALRRAGEEVRDLTEVSVDLDSLAVPGLSTAAVARLAVESLAQGAYRFRGFRAGGTARALHTLTLVSATAAAAVDEAVRRGVLAAEAVDLSRDLVNEPSGSLSPEAFAAVARRVGEDAGLDVDVLDADALAAGGFGGLLAIGGGSARPPCLARLRHVGRPGALRIALIGKGIVFDSGGLSLKSPDALIGMKHDKAGAAVVLAVMAALARSGSSLHVDAFLPLAENLPGPGAVRIGDVTTLRDGRTVEVLNSDFEGRVILADAMGHAAEFTPDVIVDVATLTESCIIALGEEIAGLVANDDDLADRVLRAAEAAGEPVWRLPLARRYLPAVRSDVADVKNFPNQRFGRALTAALFLGEAVPPGVRWAHLDIAGPAWLHARTSDGATGFGVATLLRLLEGLDSRPSEESGTAQQMEKNR